MMSLNANPNLTPGFCKYFDRSTVLKILVISLIEGLSKRIFFYNFSCHQLKVKCFMFIFVLIFYCVYFFCFILMLLLYVWYNSFCFFKRNTFIGLIFAVAFIFAFIGPEFRKVRSNIVLNCSIYRSRKFICSLCMFIRISEFLADNFRMNVNTSYLCI